jgi:hypothetical protein
MLRVGIKPAPEEMRYAAREAIYSGSANPTRESAVGRDYA